MVTGFQGSGCRPSRRYLPGPGSIGTMPAAPAAPTATQGAASIQGGLATVLAKFDALISAIKAESGFQEKVLS